MFNHYISWAHDWFNWLNRFGQWIVCKYILYSSVGKSGDKTEVYSKVYYYLLRISLNSFSKSIKMDDFSLNEKIDWKDNPLRIGLKKTENFQSNFFSPFDVFLWTAKSETIFRFFSILFGGNLPPECGNLHLISSTTENQTVQRSNEK